MELRVTISIDDLHPEKGWGCEGDEAVTYLEKTLKINPKFTTADRTLSLIIKYENKYYSPAIMDFIDFIPGINYPLYEAKNFNQKINILMVNSH